MLTPQEAYSFQKVYRAKESVREPLRHTRLVPIVGATAVGKNFLMKESKLPIGGTETTREPRDDDDPSLYTYSRLDDMLQAIEEKELVQYGVSLPDNIYGSRLRNYTLGQPNISDIWHDAVMPLQNKGFKDVRTVSIFTPKLQWVSQLAMRTDSMPFGKVDQRLSEARHSIRWSMAQHMAHAANHLIIINDAANTDDNLDRIRAFANGEHVESHSEDEILDASRGMFEAIDILYKRLGLK